MSSSRVLRNVSSNYLTYALNLAIAFVLTPILFHRLGKNDFAIFVLVQALYAILGSLDFGLIVALIRFVSDARERRETEAIQQTVSTVFFCLGALGVLLSVLMAVAGHVTTSLFGLPSADAAMAGKALGIASLGLGFELAGVVLASYLQANHEFHLQNATEVAVRVLRAAAMAFLAIYGYGLLAILAVLPISAALRLVGNLGMARCSAYPFAPNLRAVRMSGLERLGRFGLLSFLDVNVYHAFLQADVLLAARFLALPQLALIGAVRPFTGVLPQVSRQALTVAYPMVVAVEAREQREARGRFLVVGTRNWMLLSFTFAVSLWVWAAPLLELWLGADLRDGAILLRVLLLVGLAASFSYIPGTLLYGMDRVGYCATIALVSTALGVAAGAWAGVRFGTVGLAAGLLAAQVLCTTSLYVGAFHWGTIPVVKLLKGVVRPCLPALALALAVSLAMSMVLPHSWSGLMASAVLASGVSAAVFVLLLKSPERGWRATIEALVLEE